MLFDVQIVNKVDLVSLSLTRSTELFSDAGYPMTTIATFTENPVEMYSLLISHKCPSFMSYDNEKIQIITTKKPKEEK